MPQQNKQQNKIFGLNNDEVQVFNLKMIHTILQHALSKILTHIVVMIFHLLCVFGHYSKKNCPFRWLGLPNKINLLLKG